MKHLHTLIILFCAALLTACNGSEDSSGTAVNKPTGRLSINITDAPVDDAEAVVVHYTKATIKPENGDLIEIDIKDPDDDSIIGRSIDLLQLSGEKSVVLFDKELPAEKYSWIRLDVDFDPSKTYITTSTGDYPLNCTSCANNGLKLNRSFDITVDNTMAFTLDFDLRQSITETPTASPAIRTFKLRPTIRIIETAAAGSISGTVSSTLISDLGGIEGCVVYIYEGNDVSPNDLYIPETGSLPSGYNNPISTTPVELNDASIYEYTAAYLPAGDYTVSLTCDAENDDPLSGFDIVSFNETQNSNVIAGATDTISFPAP